MLAMSFFLQLRQNQQDDENCHTAAQQSCVQNRMSVITGKWHIFIRITWLGWVTWSTWVDRLCIVRFCIVTRFILIICRWFDR